MGPIRCIQERMLRAWLPLFSTFSKSSLETAKSKRKQEGEEKKGLINLHLISAALLADLK